MAPVGTEPNVLGLPPTSTCELVPDASAHVSVPVRCATPVPDRPSTAERSFASANVGLPDTPVLLVIVRPAAGAVSERVAQVSVAVRTPNPVPPSPSMAERSFARANVGLPAVPAGLLIVIPAAGAPSVRAAVVLAAVRASSPAPMPDMSAPSPPFASDNGNVNAACLPLSCACMSLVTFARYPKTVLETVPAASLATSIPVGRSPAAIAAIVMAPLTTLANHPLVCPVLTSCPNPPLARGTTGRAWT